MPHFRFEAMDVTGMEVRDTVEASSQAAALEHIRLHGYTVMEIKPVPIPRSREEIDAEKHKAIKARDDALERLPGYGYCFGLWFKSTILSTILIGLMLVVVGCVIWFISMLGSADWSFFGVQRWTLGIGLIAYHLINSFYMLVFIPYGFRVYAEEWGVSFAESQAACRKGFLKDANDETTAKDVREFLSRKVLIEALSGTVARNVSRAMRRGYM